jgi:hypothetical protein
VSLVKALGGGWDVNTAAAPEKTAAATNPPN